jgi:hypothetical protein
MAKVNPVTMSQRCEQRLFESSTVSSPSHSSMNTALQLFRGGLNEEARLEFKTRFSASSNDAQSAWDGSQALMGVSIAVTNDSSALDVFIVYLSGLMRRHLV